MVRGVRAPLSTLMPKLTLMVGLPGSGKSTVAKKYGEPSVILSSDELRAIIGNGESDQSVSGLVFRTLETMVAYFLARGQSVVIDATNITRAARLPFILIGRKYKAFVEAWVVEADSNLAKYRNARRARVVPEDVIDKMAARLEIPTDEEVDLVNFF